MSEFGRRSNAEDVVADVDLRGRRALVTGANTGIGRETARALARSGAHVVMACRDLEKAGAAREQLLEDAAGSIEAHRLEVAELDLASLESVRRCADVLLRDPAPLHILINNAGIMIPDRRETRDGFEAHFGTNHLGHYLLTRLLLERLCNSAPARIVNVSSDALHFASLTRKFFDLDWKERRFSGWRSYGDSKLMNALFANELTRRHRADGVFANALHPGIVETELARDQSALMKIVGLFMWPMMKTASQGAATSLWLATAPEFAERGGGYYADCAPARQHRLMGDAEMEEELWERSASLVGL